MSVAPLTLAPDLSRASAGAIPASAEPAAPVGRPLAQLAGPGRIVELCGEAQTTAAVTLLRQVQLEGETAAWIQTRGGDLYPPDLAAAGVDVEALIVVHTPPPAGPAEQCRAAELLLRSGGFGLVLLDFCRGEPHGSSSAWQGRLLGLARQHEARVVILRERAFELGAGSLGPLTSLRIASWIERDRRADDPPGFRPRTGSFTLRHEVLKNKSGGPIEPGSSSLRGPWGFA